MNTPPSHVLVVDDDRDVADTTAYLLQSAGHEAIAVYDGHQALEAARRCRPGLVFMDIQMPGLNGYDTAAALRKELPSTPYLILVAHTAQCHPEAVSKARRAGFDYHLVKPAAARSLLALANASVTGDTAGVALPGLVPTTEPDAPCSRARVVSAE